MKCQALNSARERQWFYIHSGNVGVFITTPSGDKYTLIRDQVIEAINSVSQSSQTALRRWLMLSWIIIIVLLAVMALIIGIR